MSKHRVFRDKFVELTYQISNDDDEIIEQASTPVGYAFDGAKPLFSKVEKALQGLQAGDEVVVELPPEEAFGEHDSTLIFTENTENVPPQFRQIGAQVEMLNENGESKLFAVTAMDDASITLDGNHPLAGKMIIFRIRIESVRDATPEEIRTTKPPAGLQSYGFRLFVGG